LAAGFFSCLFLYFTGDAAPFPCFTGAGPVKIANTDLQVAATPARLPTLSKVPGILGQRFDVDTEWTLGTVAAAKRVIDQLKIGPTSLAEPLGFQ
jgi:hypothetical protein